MLVLLGLLCLQAGPEIESAEILTGGAFRPGHWAPLEIQIRSKDSSEGEVAVRTDFGFTIVRRIRIQAGGTRFLLPAMALSTDAPLLIEYRNEGGVISRFERKRFGRGLFQSDRLIRAEGKAPDKNTVVYDWIPEISRLEWYEGVDAVVGDAPAGYAAMGGIVAEDLPGAVAQLDARGKFKTRWFEPVDAAVHELAPPDGWIVRQRDFFLWFLVLYLFSSILILGGIALWRPRLIRGAVILLPATACAVAYFCFPGGSVVVVRQSCEMAEVRGDIYFGRGEGEISFPGLVKPLFNSYQEAKNERFDLVLEENVTRVGRKADAWSVYTRIRGDVDRKLWRASLKNSRLHISGTILDGEALLEGKTVLVGDVTGNREVEVNGTRESSDPVYRYFRRKIVRDGNFLYGRITRDVRMAGDVQAVDLAEIREEPRVIVNRIGDQ